jgi:hypothetical protein
MWLLDVNMPLGLVPVLRDLGIEAHSARSRGWDMLSNGDLIGVASADGFEAILTRDRLFAEAAYPGTQAKLAIQRGRGYSPAASRSAVS